ncbi:RAS guanyl-releasing protein 4 isoform X1 [Dunckerocampus dactyliophorus]|uniref:RAS guanyl-releasing protein 4 isoform X1 n=1 Tax=Dunckerocampus dactyliophorus TaxID=161453 RepID=UPI002407458A|nr:RAS guanyl-releasing protein 4 isoform X1 [Dunckerocampus dactyliophorus]XP_054650081.1 RAS guanyl-releasing protein 4 isoform X1 [Dunckerocampus dactyliophorus]XP_054650082.1 RAS guanyl-releasing protein 4 isoform X1 [Dunckerocampus dactyliophorus]
MNRTKRKPNCESPNVLQSRKQVQRRRNTCPSPQDITRALQGPPSTPSASAASLDELILRCLNCFADSEGKLCSPRGSQTVHMTLMMHSWVVPSQTFAQKLLALYKACPPDKRGLRRGQVCHLVRTWIGQFPAVFEADPLLEQTMGDLWALVRSDGEETQLIDTSCLSPHANVSQAPSPSVKKRKVSLIFDHMEADEMAEHLSYLEFKNFCNVSFLDYRSYVVRGSVRDNPALERSVMMCNGVSQWVQLMILSRHTAQQRAQVFTKFIHVAQRLRALQNFNTLMAVTGGLCHSSISRLKDTYNLLPPDITKVLSEMTDLLSSRSNYSNYRRLYSECSGFKVPILGVHLKDLISLNEALPDYMDKDKINLSKLQHIYSNINELLALHSCTPPFEANKDLLHLLTLSLDLYYTEDEIYELSYAKEPKNPKIQPITPVKPPVVAEWGSGVTPRLDPNTISKHVKQTVDSIMKNYDHKQDGYISLEDFEKIAANFPFSFCTQETDRQGQISREEITSYFMRGMSVCAKLGYSFNDPHNFHETTYKRPTFCDTCGGFLWGVIKQGYHCKGCGMNCHKHCRDLVGMECVKKHKNTSGSCPCTPAPDSRAKGTAWSTEEEAFIFSHSNDVEHNKGAPIRKTTDSALSDRSTQTDPGMWTPEKKERRIHHPRQANTLPAERSRVSSMPVSFLQEKLEELQLSKEKSREPD